jgi:hypothetical protein
MANSLSVLTAPSSFTIAARRAAAASSAPPAWLMMPAVRSASSGIREIDSGVSTCVDAGELVAARELPRLPVGLGDAVVPERAHVRLVEISEGAAALELGADRAHQLQAEGALPDVVDRLHAGDAHHGVGDLAGRARGAEALVEALQARAHRVEHQALALDERAVLAFAGLRSESSVPQRGTRQVVHVADRLHHRLVAEEAREHRAAELAGGVQVRDAVRDAAHRAVVGRLRAPGRVVVELLQAHGLALEALGLARLGARARASAPRRGASAR